MELDDVMLFGISVAFIFGPNCINITRGVISPDLCCVYLNKITATLEQRHRREWQVE